MIKGHRQRYYNDESIHSPSLELPEKYQKDRGRFGCLEKCLEDMSKSAKEIEQLEILNEFLDNLRKTSHSLSCKMIVYRFVFDLRAETYDIDAHYFTGEMMKALVKEDETLVKEAVSETVRTAILEFPDRYETVESRSALARKIVGFIWDFKMTEEGLNDKWKEILIILTNFLEEHRVLPSEITQSVADKYIYNIMIALAHFLHKLEEKVSMDSCQEQLESLLPNILHYMAVQRYDRELHELCGVSVMQVMNTMGKVMELFESLERNPTDYSEDIIPYYLEGTFHNRSKKVLQGRENKCRILRIGATLADKLFDNFWGESTKSYFIIAIVAEMTEFIKKDLSDIHDWDGDEIQDLLKTFEICFKLAKYECNHYFTRPIDNILSFCMKQEESAFERFEEGVFADISSKDCSVKTRSTMIRELCTVYSSAEVLQRLPNVISLLREDFKTTKECDLTCHGESCTHSNTSLKALVELSETTIEPKDQYELFLKYLLCECQAFPQGGWYRKQVKALLKLLITATSDITVYIIEDTQKIPTEMVLFALNCMKKYPEKFPKNPVLRELVIKGLVTFDENTRVAAAKVFQEISGDLQNLDLFLDLLKFGVIFQQKSLESKINWMGLLNPALSRKNRTAEEKDTIQKFITDFREALFEHFYAGGSFPRQRYALKILKDTWSIYTLDPWEIKHLDAVFSCFDSPFEYVKKLVTECLKKFPKDLLEKWIEERFGDPAASLEKLKELMTSVRPADSLQVAYQLVIFSRIAPKLFPNSLFDNETDNILAVVEWCVGVLQQGIENAKQSLLKASATNPLYGTILCIRYLLDDLPRGKYKKVSQYLIKETPRWRSFYEKILILCSEASEIVAPIVNNSSPEGFLPEDSTLLDSLDDKATPQMVLLCGWRTIKEVSLLLGEICEKTPQTSNLISPEEIIKIGENLTEILLESKHRGAFEVSAVGFSKLCTRLHLSSCSTINNLPKEWLEELLNAVLCPDKRQPSTRYVKLCVTRRSAGLPFLIQAIITSYDPLLLTYAIKRLLKESQKNTEGRIHCMNILRYIYRCSALNTYKHAGDGLLMAIESFGSTSWAERNSATLLFSAVIVRIFGVCRSKGATEELDFLNTWIFSEFFNDYPSLYDFMFRELKEANEKLEVMESVPQLYPIFLVLERLPVLNGHWAPFYDTSKFIQEIERIPAKCHDLRIRVLATKALIAITHPTDFEKRLSSLLTLEVSQNPNEYHSRLLQVKEIFRKYAKKDVSFIHKNLDHLIELHKLHSSDCLIIAKLFMEILIKYLPKANILSESSHNYLEDFLIRLKSILLRKGTVVGRTAVQSSFLLLKLTLAQDCEAVANFLIECLTQDNGVIDAMLISALNIILLLNGVEKHETPEEIRSEIPDLEVEFVSSFNEDVRNLILMKIVSTNELFDQQALSNNPLVSTRAFLCKPIIRENVRIDANEINNQLSDEMISEDDKTSVIRKVLGNFSAVDNRTVDTVFQLKIETLLEFCGCEKSDFTRMNTSLLVAEILKICSTDRRYNRQFFLQLTRVVMQLLRDDDPDVRKIICTAILLYSRASGTADSSAFLNPVDDVHIPCDSFALNIYLENVIPKKDSIEFFEELLKLEEVDAAQENQDIVEDEWRVFDTKEANLFADRESMMRTIRYFMKPNRDN